MSIENVATYTQVAEVVTVQSAARVPFTAPVVVAAPVQAAAVTGVDGTSPFAPTVSPFPTARPNNSEQASSSTSINVAPTFEVVSRSANQGDSRLASERPTLAPRVFIPTPTNSVTQLEPAWVIGVFR